jgi:hypothetical protein
LYTLNALEVRQMYGTHTLAFQRIFVRMKIIALIFIRFSYVSLIRNSVTGPLNVKMPAHWLPAWRLNEVRHSSNLHKTTNSLTNPRDYSFYLTCGVVHDITRRCAMLVLYLTNIKHFPCWYTVISTRVEIGRTRNYVETWISIPREGRGSYFICVNVNRVTLFINIYNTWLPSESICCSIHKNCIIKQTHFEANCFAKMWKHWNVFFSYTFGQVLT